VRRRRVASIHPQNVARISERFESAHLFWRENVRHPKLIFV
jgi:hypothetical protein